MFKFKRIYVEITNQCNLNCPFCTPPHRGVLFMNKDLFVKIIEEIKPFTNEIALHVLGEPTLHPNLLFFLQHCKSNNIKVLLTTNGTQFANVNILPYIDTFSQINFSIHSLLHANITQKHLGTILNFCKSLSHLNYFPYINFRFWDMTSSNITNTYKDEICDTLYTIIDSINPSFDKSIINNIDTHKKFNYIKLLEKFYINFGTQFVWPNLSLNEISSTGFCYGLQSHIGILCDGTVVPCCLDSMGTINLGNVNNESFSSILQTPRVKKMRDGFSKKILCENLCKRCNYILRFNNK